MCWISWISEKSMPLLLVSPKMVYSAPWETVFLVPRLQIETYLLENGFYMKFSSEKSCFRRSRKQRERFVVTVSLCYRALNVKWKSCTEIITTGWISSGFLMIVTLTWNWFQKMDTIFGAISNHQDTSALSPTDLYFSESCKKDLLQH